MTNARAEKRQALREKRCRGVAGSLTRRAVILLSALLLWFVLRDPRASAEAVREGLLLAGLTVLPSLFPLLVLSSLFVEESIGSGGRRTARIFESLFGVSRAGMGAFLLGLLCGFPIGARILMGAYERGALSEEEVERLLPISNGPSLVFLFSAVGCGLFGDPAFGLLLYASSILSTCLCGVLIRLLRGKCKQTGEYLIARSHEPFSARFVRAVSEAGRSSVTITAFIAFFSVLSGALLALLSRFNASDTTSLLSSGLLELSSGMKKAAETESGLCGRVLCGFFAGWGGLCAHLQVIATAERPLPDRARRKAFSFRSYFLSKLVIGLFSAAFVFLLSLF